MSNTCRIQDCSFASFRYIFPINPKLLPAHVPHQFDCLRHPGSYFPIDKRPSSVHTIDPATETALHLGSVKQTAPSVVNLHNGAVKPLWAIEVVAAARKCLGIYTATTATALPSIFPPHIYLFLAHWATFAVYNRIFFNPASPFVCLGSRNKNIFYYCLTHSRNSSFDLAFYF